MSNVIDFKKPLAPLPETFSDRVQWILEMLDCVDPANEKSHDLLGAAKDMLCFLSLDLEDGGQ